MDCKLCEHTIGEVGPGHLFPLKEAGWLPGVCIPCALRVAKMRGQHRTNEAEGGLAIEPWSIIPSAPSTALPEQQLQQPDPCLFTGDYSHESHVRALISCVCQVCATYRAVYPNWQPPSLARLHKSESDLSAMRGICSHPDCDLAIETYCSSCHLKLCREHLGPQRREAPVICASCRATPATTPRNIA